MDKVKSLLPHIHPDNALLSQLRVNRSELSPKSAYVDHLLDRLAQLFSSYILNVQDIMDSKFTLVAFCRTTSAKLKNLDQDIHTALEAVKSIIVKEEQALGRMSKH